MRRLFTTLLAAAAALIATSCCDSCSESIDVAASSHQGAVLFNDGWRFTLKESGDYTLTNYNPAEDRDAGWRDVKIPHDWSIELGTVNDPKRSDGATAYFPGGIGWYSKSFESPIKEGERCVIIFDGVYNNAEYWLNGKQLGVNPYGYSPAYFDITNYLRPAGQSNEMMVRVDHSHFVDSRWYTGSGIYRDVELLITDNLYIPVYGTYITTPEVSEQSATVAIETELKSDYCSAKSGVLLTQIVDEDDEQVAQVATNFSIAAGEMMTIKQQTKIADPELWELDDTDMYYAKSRIIVDGVELECRTTRFGVRTIRFDAATGFYLNGENMKIKGVCLHHDGGLVGAAVPKDVWVRRLEILKEGGCNAIRASHNPTSAEFLEACDEVGMLVQQEFFDEWDNPKDKRFNMNERVTDYPSQGYSRFFQEWGERDLKIVAKRDRNNPSVFQWSIGNEIEWTYEGCKESTGFFGADAAGGYFWNQPPYSPERIRKEWESQPKQTYHIGKTAKKLADWTREMDTTRPVTANCILPSISYETGYIDALDVAGFSYRRVMYDYAHEHYPNKPVMGTENLGQYHEWKAVMERDYVPGMFIWTGIDYLGEMGGKHGVFPDKVKGCGLLSCAGFKEPSFYMMKSLWCDEPMIAIYSQLKGKSYYKEQSDGSFTSANPKKRWDNRLWDWEAVNRHWNYKAGDKLIVELYSNCDEVELLLDGKSLGRKSLSQFEDHIYKWAVDYKAGELTAKGTKDGKSVEQSIVTAGQPVRVELTVDEDDLDADGVSVAHVVAQLYDAQGRIVRYTERPMEFVVEGAKLLAAAGENRILGCDNGASGNIDDYLGTKVKSLEGRALLIVQAGQKESEIKVRAKIAGVKSNEVTIKVER